MVTELRIIGVDVAASPFMDAVGWRRHRLAGARRRIMALSGVDTVPAGRRAVASPHDPPDAAAPVRADNRMGGASDHRHCVHGWDDRRDRARMARPAAPDARAGDGRGDGARAVLPDAARLWLRLGRRVASLRRDAGSGYQSAGGGAPNTAVRRASRSRARPESSDSRAISTPSRRSGARPATTSAAALFSRTASR